LKNKYIYIYTHQPRPSLVTTRSLSNNQFPRNKTAFIFDQHQIVSSENPESIFKMVSSTWLSAVTFAVLSLASASNINLEARQVNAKGGPAAKVPDPKAGAKAPTPAKVPDPKAGAKAPTPAKVPDPKAGAKAPTPAKVPDPKAGAKAPTPAKVPDPKASTKAPTPAKVPDPKAGAKAPTPAKVPDPKTTAKTPSPPPKLAISCPPGQTYYKPGTCSSGFSGCTANEGKDCHGAKMYHGDCPKGTGAFYVCAASGFIGCSTTWKICG